ncbi:MAG: hypothetical protein OHK006_03110 [Thermodesulfovibrionales bacterium]
MKPARRQTRQKPARGNRLAQVSAPLRLFLFAVLPGLAVLGLAIAVFSVFGRAFTLETFETLGNEHLTDEEVRLMTGLRSGENMFGISSKNVHRKLRESPWIRSVSVRKEFPGRVEVRIREAAPFALLDMKGKLFLVDDAGRMLEELKSDTIPFLPMIASDPFKEQDAYREAVSFVQSIRKSGILANRERIEIVSHAPQEMSVAIDGMVVKVGAGDYEEKLQRFAETEQEIRKRNIPVDYIDLRFAKKVVVKPVHEVVR